MFGKVLTSKNSKAYVYKKGQWNSRFSKNDFRVLSPDGTVTFKEKFIEIYMRAYTYGKECKLGLTIGNVPPDMKMYVSFKKVSGNTTHLLGIEDINSTKIGYCSNSPANTYDNNETVLGYELSGNCNVFVQYNSTLYATYQINEIWLEKNRGGGS